MTSKETFEKHIKDKSFFKVGEFKNKHGEQFVMYLMLGIIQVFITGDEMDWEVGWRYEQYDREVTLGFMLTGDEAEEAEKIYQKFRRPKRMGRL